MSIKTQTVEAMRRSLVNHDAFDVYLDGRHVDTVFATGYTAEEMRRSLVDHDGYDPRITVRRAKR